MPSTTRCVCKVAFFEYLPNFIVVEIVFQHDKLAGQAEEPFRRHSWYDRPVCILMSLYLGDYFVGCLKILGLVVFFLVSVSGAFAEETHGKTDACLVTLYNYPAESPKYDITKKAPPQSPLTQTKNLRASKAAKNTQPRKSLLTQVHSKK